MTTDTDLKISQEELDAFFQPPSTTAPLYDAELQQGVSLPMIRINTRAGDTAEALKVDVKDEYGQFSYVEEEELPVIIMQITDSRVYFGDGAFNPDARRECWSEQGVVPHPAGKNPHGVSYCKSCPLSWWADRTPPRCREQFNLFVYNIAYKGMFLLRLDGMNYRYGRADALASARFARKVIGLRTKTATRGNTRSQQVWQELDLENIYAREATPEEQIEALGAFKVIEPNIPRRIDALRELGMGGIIPPKAISAPPLNDDEYADEDDDGDLPF